MARKFVAASSQAIDCGRAGFLVPDNGLFAVSCWANLDTFSGSAETLMAKGYNGSVTAFSLDRTNTFFLKILSFDGGTVHGALGTWGRSLGDWGHVYADYNGATWSIYFDGVSAATSTEAGPQSNSTRFGLGSVYHDGLAQFVQPFSGSLADCALWTGIVLSPAEIRALATGVQRPDSIRPQRLEGYWRLDGLGHPALDLSVYRRNGILVNAPAFAPDPPLLMPLADDAITLEAAAIEAAAARMMGQIWM